MTALDADVPLLRPSLIRFNVSELRSIQSLPSRPSARCLLLFNASQTKLLPFCTFGIRFAYPSLKNPEKGASTKLLKQTGGKLAFGKPVDILTWEYTSGKVHKAEWDVPANWANKMISEIEMPEYLIPIIRKRRNNTEVVHADQYWQAGDRIIFLSSTSPARTEELLLLLV